MASERDDDLLDIISDALDESMDVDWTSRDGARHVLGALQIGGYLATPPPASADAMGEVERIGAALRRVHSWDGSFICADAQLTDEEVTGLATAALSAMSPAGEVERRECGTCHAIVAIYDEVMCCHCQTVPWAKVPAPMKGPRHD